MEGQPADGEHHHHGHQHLRGLAAPAVAFGAGTTAGAVLGRADVASQFGPDAGVGEGDDGQRQEVLQDEHGDAVDGAVGAFPRPLLRAHLADANTNTPLNQLAEVKGHRLRSRGF